MYNLFNFGKFKKDILFQSYLLNIPFYLHLRCVFELEVANAEANHAILRLVSDYNIAIVFICVSVHM